MKKVKQSTRKEQAAKTKNLIYETAYKLMKEQGFENVSVDKIMKTTGLSKGSFYVHFESKSALASILIQDLVNEMDLDYKSYVETVSMEKTASETLLLLGEKIADVISHALGYDNMKTLYIANLTKSISTETTTSYDRQLIKIFFEILNSGIKNGEFRDDLDPNTLSQHFILALRGLTYEWCIRYPDFNLKEQALEHFDILLKGIRTIQ